jgi:putative ABC transport system substrate-binding protein
MNRRSAISALIASLATPAGSQGQTARMPRIGYLTLAPLSAKPSGERLAFLEQLAEFGYVDGKTAQIINRSGEMDLDILEFAVRDLIDAKVDVIAAAGAIPALAVKRATRTIPIVMIFASEPVVSGLVKDLARPGGNVTGVSTMQTELDPKRLAMLKEMRPSMTRVAVLWTRFHPSHAAELRAVEKAAVELGLTLDLHDVTRDLLGVLDRMDEDPPDAVFVMWDVRTLSYRQYIVDFANKHGLPTSMPLEPYVVSGALMSYGPNVRAIFQRSAWYVHRILRGAKPADLPVERPTKFDLVINLKTAKKLDLTPPPALMLLADKVIE